jgi:membrane fusion protein, multidrug efflux system
MIGAVRFFGIILGGLGVVTLSWMFDAQAQPRGPQGPLSVSVIEAQATNIPNVLEITAQAEGAKETEVRARVNGILLKRLFEEGSWVEAGQPLFQIDPEPFKIALEEAQARAKQTAREAARLKLLFSKQAVSRKEFDDASSINEIAQATLKTAQLNLQWTTVTAPVAGITGRALRSEGNLISNSGDAGLLTSIYQINPIWVRFGLSSSDTAQLPSGRLDPKQNTSVELLLPNGRVYPEKGRLNFQSTFIDPKLGTQQMRAEFPNPKSEILPGQFLRVRVTTGMQENVFLVPQAAVVQNERGFMVWTVGPDAKVVATPIKVGKWSGKNWIVLSGLKNGDRVVTDQLIKIRPGGMVKPTVVSLSDASPSAPQSAPHAASTKEAQ